MLNLHRDKKVVGENREKRREKILSDHRQDGNVAVGGTGILTSLRPTFGRKGDTKNSTWGEH